jgi:nucleotide-binding universal stress UspA family protein
MKKMLVLVDFSAPSINAVTYAADLAGDRGGDEIVLVANLHVPLFEQIVPTPDLIQVGAADINSRREAMMGQLEELRSRVEKRLTRNSSVRVAIGALPLLRSVLEQVAKEDPSLVIIGSSHDTREDCSIGRQIVPLVKLIPVPVLVIPPKSSYRPISQALVAGSVEPPPGTKESLSYLLKDATYQLYALKGKDILQGVIKAAEEKKAQLIIALPGRHSFLYNLTHQDILHGIVLNATTPVLILK